MSHSSSIPAPQDENRLAFLRYLPKRVEAFEHRIRRYGNSGWDPTGMMVLRGDVQRLAEGSGRYNLVESKRHLAKLAQRVGEHIAKRTTPNPQQTSRMFEQLSAVVAESQALLEQAQAHPGPSETAPANTLPAQTSPAKDVTSEVPVARHEHPAVIEPVKPAEPDPLPASTQPTATAVPLAQPDEPLEQDEPAGNGETEVRRIYHLSDANTFAAALGRRLETEGYAVESLETVDEVSELVMCMLPHVLLVDASHLSDLAALNRLRNQVQQRPRPQRRIQLVAMAPMDGAETRRAVQGAEVDLLLVPPFDIGDTVDRMQALHASATREKVRILIVEDNRADAFYVQTVLINAGMQAHVEQDPLKVLESLKLLRPDLILMDLHMPFANGVEVTMLIREHPLFARLPIVFLSGESDPVSRIEAINAGGDDFLSKPIRPRDLVAAVRDRMRRLHPIGKQGAAVGA